MPRDDLPRLNTVNSCHYRSRLWKLKNYSKHDYFIARGLSFVEPDLYES